MEAIQNDLLLGCMIAVHGDLQKLQSFFSVLSLC